MRSRPVAVGTAVVLAVRPAITRWGERLSILGTVASRRADQKVTVQFKGCGLFPREFRDAVFVTAALPFYGKRVLLQRLDRLGRWVTVRRLLLTEQLANNPQFGLPSVSSSTQDFRLRFPTGTTLRAVLSRSAARPCYLAGYSNVVRM